MFEKAPYPEHPGRCQAVNSQGQCPNLGIRLDDSDGDIDVFRGPYCMAHGGNHAQEAHNKKKVRNYRLTIAKFRAQLDDKLDSDGLKDLREEISILRICLETRLNTCNDAMDLILQSGAISDMVMKINTVVQSCHKLEGSMGQLLDKQAILQFAQVVIGIVSKTLEDEPEKINTIADAILATIGQIGQLE